jgi:hypothetical protein
MGSAAERDGVPSTDGLRRESIRPVGHASRPYVGRA